MSSMQLQCNATVNFSGKIGMQFMFCLHLLWQQCGQSSPVLPQAQFGSAGDPQIVLTGSSSDEVGVVRVDLASYLMTLQLKI